MTGTVEYDLGAGAVPAKMTTPESLDLYRFYARMREAGCAAAVSEVSSHSLVNQRPLMSQQGTYWASAQETKRHGSPSSTTRAGAVEPE
jgi:hypothetical protein